MMYTIYIMIIHKLSLCCSHFETPVHVHCIEAASNCTAQQCFRCQAFNQMFLDLTTICLVKINNCRGQITTRQARTRTRAALVCSLWTSNSVFNDPLVMLIGYIGLNSLSFCYDKDKMYRGSLAVASAEFHSMVILLFNASVF